MGFGSGDMRSQLRLSALLRLLIAATHFVRAARSSGIEGEAWCGLSNILTNWKETDRGVNGNQWRYAYEIEVTNACKSCDTENISLEVHFSSDSASPDTVIVKPIPKGRQVSFQYRTTLPQNSQVVGVRATDTSFVNCNPNKA